MNGNEQIGVKVEQIPSYTYQIVKENYCFVLRMDIWESKKSMEAINSGEVLSTLVFGADLHLSGYHPEVALHLRLRAYIL
jgi:hypothetical protein